MDDRRIPKTNNILESRYSNDDWLNIMGFGDKIFNFIKTLKNGVLSKLGIA